MVQNHKTPSCKLRDSLSSLQEEPTRTFPATFMNEHTEFDTFEALLEERDWLDARGSVRYDVTVGHADQLVRERTNFENWAEMVAAAQQSLWDRPRRNRRRFRRYDCSVDVVLELGINESTRATLLDVSRSGLGLEAPKPVPTVRTLTVKLPIEGAPLPSNPLKVRGAVRWREEGPTVRMGVELLDKTG